MAQIGIDNKKAIALTSDVDKNDYKEEGQSWIVWPELFRKINEKIPGKNGNCRTLLTYLVMQRQNGDFNPAEATVLKYCGFNSHDAYQKAREWLDNEGLITYTPFREIKINYKKIME